MSAYKLSGNSNKKIHCHCNVGSDSKRWEWLIDSKRKNNTRYLLRLRKDTVLVFPGCAYYLRTGWLESERPLPVWSQLWLIQRPWGNPRADWIDEVTELEWIWEFCCWWFWKAGRGPEFEGKVTVGLGVEYGLIKNINIFCRGVHVENEFLGKQLL